MSFLFSSPLSASVQELGFTAVLRIGADSLKVSRKLQSSSAMGSFYFLLHLESAFSHDRPKDPF
jgi:hypothetical protein